MANPLDRVWSALSDASNALGEAMDYNVNSKMSAQGRNDWRDIDRAIDDVTRLVIARIEKDERLAND